MATIVYLDAEDEITSAASRIRAAGDARVGLVLPFGSRVATSRINFRLLAREAQANGRRLDIVAPDASARALAASAGLPVFSSVGEYEAALDAEDDAAEAGAPTPGAAATAGLAGAALGMSTATGGQGAPGTAPKPLPDTAPTERLRGPITEPASRDYGAPGITDPALGEPRVVHGRRRGPGRRGFALVLALLVLVGAGGVAAYLLLPTATITVTPVIETIGPISFTVTADPGATAVDPGAGVIPATTLEIPVTVESTFEATGKRVEETKATGGVRFQNCDPSAAYRIPAGSIVRTRAGVGFATQESLFLPVATISGTPPNISVKCQSSEVAVTAVEAGPDGNVGAGEIRVVPARYNRNLVRVTNPAATSGGTRQEFKRVAKKDVDAAVAQLTEQLSAQFAIELENPDRIPEGTTVFPETAVLGTPTTVPPDPTTLVGQEVDTFTLQMNATGTVQAVDATPVEAIAEERLKASIAEGYELVEDSTSIRVGDGSVRNGVITFPVEGSAKQLRPLDAAALEAMVVGLPEAEAETVLAAYGEVAIVLWPDWVSSIPSLDQRVTVTVAEPVDPAAGASPSPEPTEAPATPEPSPTNELPSEPVPSG